MHSIPCYDTLLNRTDDIGGYLYLCLKHKKCAICGGKADLHHFDAVGMGRNRKEIIHEGMRCLPLCRKHHCECHNIGQLSFNKQYHIYGIKLDRFLCEKLKLK
jgi:hypothetical protein